MTFQKMRMNFQEFIIFQSSVNLFSPKFIHTKNNDHEVKLGCFLIVF